MRKTGELRVLSLLHDNYRDFGPTLAAEKLRERYNITVSAETLRKWAPFGKRKILYVKIVFCTG